MPKVSQVEIFKVNIPFRVSFRHALKKRAVSESIFLKVALENGMTGFGESTPRSYVTGNSQDSVFKELSGYAQALIGLELKDEGSVDSIRGLEGIEGEGRCATEIALLDCLGKVCDKSISELIGDPLGAELVYSLVVSGDSLVKAGLISAFARAQGYRHIKVKVGSENDVARVSLCRRITGNADIRIDANGAWDSATALEMIKKLRDFNISSIEQPTPKNDIDGMQEVSDFCDEPVIADESLCTREDALMLAQVRACDMFNVRLSKCGGIFKSSDIIKIARDNNIGYQIGCHVGESGILSAAARHLASVTPNVKYLEGSYSRYLLKEDIIEEDLTPRRGIGYALSGAGLCVKVREEVLRKYSDKDIVVY